MTAEYTQQLKECRLVMMNILARREHSAFELKQKSKDKILTKWHKKSPSQDINYHQLTDVIDQCLAQLQQQKLQCDRRYTEIYVRNRSQALYGPERITAELHKKGIENALIEQLMDEAAIDWQWSLQLALDKKCTENPANLNLGEQHKLMAYLCRRGFNEYDVRHLCQQDYCE